jgi:hypothetical protein
MRNFALVATMPTLAISVPLCPSPGDPPPAPVPLLLVLVLVLAELSPPCPPAPDEELCPPPPVEAAVPLGEPPSQPTETAMAKYASSQPARRSLVFM